MTSYSTNKDDRVIFSPEHFANKFVEYFNNKSDIIDLWLMEKMLYAGGKPYEDEIKDEIFKIDKEIHQKVKDYALSKYLNHK